MMNPTSGFFVIMLSSVLFVGCTTPPAKSESNQTEASPPVFVSAKPVVSLLELPREPSEDEKKLGLALAAFDRGEYAVVIRQLTPLVKVGTLDVASQLRALRSLAFSQCLSRALVDCRRTFERAFRLDEKFELAPAERGHPVWGPQFERARKTILGQNSK